MKKILVLVIALMLVLAFAACGQEAENTELPEETVNTENENTENEEDTALYEDILVNFGGIRRHDGSIVVSRKGSFYDFREGIEDCSAMAPEAYYTWVVSGTENSDKIKVMPAGFESEVYAYSADFFEGEVAKYFGVSAEALQASEYYYSEPGCYYYEGVSSAAEYTQIDFVSAEENGENLTVHFTLSDSTNGTTNHALTVKMLADGGYNYVSYIAE